MILFVKTDNPEAYVALWADGHEIAAKTWTAGRELSIQILAVIKAICSEAKVGMTDFEGIVVYEGPGSYTGLRIGISVANSIGYSYQIPIAGVSGNNWQSGGLVKLKKIKAFEPVSPEYGGEVRTTKPRK